MNEFLESKLMIGTVIFFILLFFIGGLLTRNIDTSSTVTETTSFNM